MNFPSMIKNLSPALGERGKIKVGRKGQMMRSKAGNDFQPPVKLDHFLITTMQRGPDDNFIRDEEIHASLGPKPTEIPVRLLYDDIGLNFQCRYTCYKGRQRWCVGDGETAARIIAANKTQQVTCPCERQAPDYQGPEKCKINGCLSVIIDGAATVGGVWRFRTTSFNSTMAILSSLSLIKSVTGGPLAGIPLFMTLTPKTVANPVDGKSQTIHVAGLEYRGGIDELRAIGYDVAMKRQTHQIKMGDIEAQARKLLSYEDPVSDEDVVEEFYPEQAVAAEAGPVNVVAPVVEEHPAAPPPQKTPEERFIERIEAAMIDRIEMSSYLSSICESSKRRHSVADIIAMVIDDEARFAEMVKDFKRWRETKPAPAEAPPQYQPDHTARNDRTGMGALYGETFPPPVPPPLTVFELAAKTPESDEMAEALMVAGVTNIPTATADKIKVGEALIEIRKRPERKPGMEG